jgi:hypothetical protein
MKFTISLLVILLSVFAVLVSATERFYGQVVPVYYHVIQADDQEWTPEHQEQVNLFIEILRMDHSPERDDLIEKLTGYLNETEAAKVKEHINWSWCSNHFLNQSLGIRENEYLYKPYYNREDCINKITYGKYEIPPQKECPLPEQHISVSYRNLLVMSVFVVIVIDLLKDASDEWTLFLCVIIHLGLYFVVGIPKSEMEFLMTLFFTSIQACLTLFGGLYGIQHAKSFETMAFGVLLVTIPTKGVDLLFVV